MSPKFAQVTMDVAADVQHWVQSSKTLGHLMCPLARGTPISLDMQSHPLPIHSCTPSAAQMLLPWGKSSRNRGTQICHRITKQINHLNVLPTSQPTVHMLEDKGPCVKTISAFPSTSTKRRWASLCWKALLKLFPADTGAPKTVMTRAPLGSPWFRPKIQPESSGFWGVTFPDKLKTGTLIITSFQFFCCISWIFTTDSPLRLLGPDLSVHQWIEGCLSWSEKAHQVDRVILKSRH